MRAIPRFVLVLALVMSRSVSAAVPRLVAAAEAVTREARKVAALARPPDQEPRPPGFRNRQLRRELERLAVYGEQLSELADRSAPSSFRLRQQATNLVMSRQRARFFLSIGGARHLDAVPPAFSSLEELVGTAVDLARSGGTSAPPPGEDPGERLVQVPSPDDVASTMDRLVAAVEGAGLGIFARIDHQANAHGADLELRPTQVLVFGNPKAGTLLMQSNQAIGMALPLKVLVWEDEGGQTWVGYLRPAQLLEDFGITDRDALLEKLTEALEGLAGAAAGG